MTEKGLRRLFLTVDPRLKVFQSNGANPGQLEKIRANLKTKIRAKG
jgi:hypothetical protein